MTEAFLKDCMEGMKQYPDKYFDLAVVDPPYGDGNGEFKRSDKTRFGGKFDKYYINKDSLKSVKRTGNGWSKKYQTNGGIFDKDITYWDIAPSEEYFEELFRVSKNQIIWGGNYFSLPPTRCFLVWEKLTISEKFSMAMAEYAWTSFNDNAKLFKAAPQGTAKEKRIHPTQKLVSLYAWIYKLYAKPGDKILDTHLGSGSSRIAAYDANLDFTGFEIDPTYFNMQEERFAKYTSTLKLFDI